jgi:hypothetical protein
MQTRFHPFLLAQEKEQLAANYFANTRRNAPLGGSGFRPMIRWIEYQDFFESLPDPDFLPPPDILFSVAQARRSASFSVTPRFSYPSSMWCAWRFCLSV